MKSSRPISSQTLLLGYVSSAPERRGNSIVLVTGILVLLVIIATAYVSRTQSGRVSSGGVNSAGLRLDMQHVVADMLADEVSGDLFMRQIDGAGLFDVNFSANSDMIRLLPDLNATRHGLDPFFPYNHAPYEVVPSTNWPDLTWNVPGGTFSLPTPNFWPSGVGNPTPFLPTLYWLAAETNPLGNPGFGDSRWLRSFEPLRITLDVNGDGFEEQFYTHWRHMTNIARPDNGWRVCRDISDIEFHGVVDNLNIPIEQWTIFTPPGAALANGNLSTGHYVFNGTNFEGLWDAWFTLAGYEAALFNPNLAPPNIYCMNDLDGDGFYNEADFESPEDEFVFGFARNRVGRVLADADGDGFTDSFWFLAPSTIQSGIRSVVAVTIVDNCAMLNVNVATRSIANDAIPNPTGGKKTIGSTPADLALVGQLIAGIQSNNSNVGFFDNPDHDNVGPGTFGYQFDYLAPDRWERHPLEVGLPTYTGPALNLLTQNDRLNYWLNSGSKALSDVLPSRYTPFTLSDEIELRSYWGRNTPWNYSRFEYSVQYENVADGESFLRANSSDDEASEFGDPVPNRLLVKDPRHRLTMYSAARNDLMPPYLWMYSQNVDLDGDGDVDGFDDAIFHRGMQKFDLRQTYGQFLDGDFNPLNNPPPPGLPIIETEQTLAANPARANLLWGIVLRDRIKRALMDEQGNVNIPNPNSYYGNTTIDLDKTNEMATGIAANIVQRRDKEAVPPPGWANEVSRLSESVPVVGLINAPTGTPRMMGMEPQPFLLEAFVGHVYKGVLIPDADLEGDPYTNALGYVVLEADPLSSSGGDRRTTVIAVQIANPFEMPLNLEGFRINVFGQPYDLPALVLPPAIEDRPSTAIFYAIDDDFDQDQNADPASGPGFDPTMQRFRTRWLHFLSLLPANLDLTGSIAQDVGSAWSTGNRSNYDTNNDGVELLRLDPDTASTQWVVIDRFDDPNEPSGQKFAEAVNNLGATPIDVEPNPLNSPDVPPIGGPYPLGIPLEPNGPETGNRFRHWVQWARVTRAWGADLSMDGVYDQNEKSPRFVFGDKAISTARETAPPTSTLIANGNKYRFDEPPDVTDTSVDPPLVSLWFGRDYTGTDGLTRISKPTFFDMRTRDPMVVSLPINNFPDKGWYSQAGGVDGAITGSASMRLRFPFQLLQKDGEYEQIGEVLNTLCFGHKIDATEAAGVITYNGTLKTFSEYLNPETANVELAGDDIYVNRLRSTQVTINAATLGNTIGVGVNANLADPRHAYPDLPAAARLFEGLVCDGPGLTGTYGVNNFDLAKGFERQGTPGLINPNTAPVEVMRSLPYWYRLVHENGSMAFPTPNFTDPQPTPPPQFPLFNFAGQPLVTTGLDPAAMLPRSMLPEAVVHYRERFNGKFTGPFLTGLAGGPNYELRAGSRGLSSIGELLLLTTNGEPPNPNPYLTYPTANAATNDFVYPEQWRIDLGLSDPAGNVPRPFMDAPGAGRKQVSMRLGIDRSDVLDPHSVNADPNLRRQRDLVAGDAEEANMLFAGISNLITTRSDTFTVYFKVRSFRQNTSVTPPVWDATNKDYIVDDSRYVMLVDRSNVNKPGDKPRILYLEKLPN